MAYEIHRVNRERGTSVKIATGFRTKAEATDQAKRLKKQNPEFSYPVLKKMGR